METSEPNNNSNSKQQSRLFNQTDHNQLLDTTHKLQESIVCDFQEISQNKVILKRKNSSLLEKELIQEEEENSYKICDINLEINKKNPVNISNLSNSDQGIKKKDSSANFSQSGNNVQTHIRKNSSIGVLSSNVYNFNANNKKFYQASDILDYQNWPQEQKRQNLKVYLFLQRLKKSMRQIQLQLPSNMYKVLKQFHLQMLGDKSEFQQQQKQLITNNSKPKTGGILNEDSSNIYHHNQNQNKVQKIQSKFQNFSYKISKFLKQMPVINPHHSFAIYMDVLTSFNILLWVFLYSIHICFKFDTDQLLIWLLLIWSIFYFFIEFFMKFNTGFYQAGKLVTDRYEIFQKQKNNTMVYDLLAFVPQLYNLSDSGRNLTNFFLETLFFLKLHTFIEIFVRIENVLYLKGVRSHLVQLGKMFFQLVIMCHIIGCFWNVLLVFEDEQLHISNNWLETMNLKGQPVQVIYMEAFYWAVATIMLIGSKGETFLETMFVTIVLLLTVGVFAYLISTISMIIQELNVDVQQYKNDLEVINRYIKIKKIQNSTQQKIRGSIEYFYQDSKEINNTIKAHEVLNKLPVSLKDEIQYEINTNEMNYFKFITNNFSKKAQDLLKKCMVEKNVVTNEIIFHQNSYDDIGIYYVQKGSVDIYYKNMEQQIFNVATVKQGDFIGDSSFISGLSYKYSAKTTSFATLLCIKRKDFLDIVKQNKEDFEKFAVVLHQFKMYGLSKYYSKECLICGLKYHFEENCKLLNFQPKKGTVYLRNNQSYPIEERVQYYRKKYTQQALDPALMNKLENQVFQQIKNDEDFQDYYDQLPDIDEISDIYSDDQYCSSIQTDDLEQDDEDYESQDEEEEEILNTQDGQTQNQNETQENQNENYENSQNQNDQQYSNKDTQEINQNRKSIRENLQQDKLDVLTETNKDQEQDNSGNTTELQQNNNNIQQQTTNLSSKYKDIKYVNSNTDTEKTKQESIIIKKMNNNSINNIKSNSSNNINHLNGNSNSQNNLAHKNLNYNNNKNQSVQQLRKKFSTNQKKNRKDSFIYDSINMEMFGQAGSIIGQINDEITPKKQSLYEVNTNPNFRVSNNNLPKNQPVYTMKNIDNQSNNSQNLQMSQYQYSDIKKQRTKKKNQTITLKLLKNNSVVKSPLTQNSKSKSRISASSKTLHTKRDSNNSNSKRFKVPTQQSIFKKKQRQRRLSKQNTMKNIKSFKLLGSTIIQGQNLTNDLDSKNAYRRNSKISKLSENFDYLDQNTPSHHVKIIDNGWSFYGKQCQIINNESQYQAGIHQNQVNDKNQYQFDQLATHFYFFYAFEKSHEWRTYFPYQNLQVLVQKYKKWQMGDLQKKRKEKKEKDKEVTRQNRDRTQSTHRHSQFYNQFQHQKSKNP